jgi:hypothetical protein
VLAKGTGIREATLCGTGLHSKTTAALGPGEKVREVWHATTAEVDSRAKGMEENKGG